ncbi:MAG: relaxase/mobilization nuclease domain-containing protein [Xanthobacteraceae bacterium]
MILKGSQRAGGTDLALHLMNEFDNERVEVASVRRAVADDLYGALAEFDAIAAGTRCKNHLYSLSINPPQALTRSQYAASIDRIEAGLGLSGQPRAVVFHVKNGREHCHVVWSRIDTSSLKAIHISHDRMKLRTLSRELGHAFGLGLPEGLAKDLRQERGPSKQMTLAEKRQAEQTGITPEERRKAITQAYCAADSGHAFKASLSELGYELARGERRAFVVVDRYGDVHSLARQIDGVNTRAVKAKLAPLKPSDLPDVDQVRAALHARQKAVQDASRDRIRAGTADALASLERKQAFRRQAVDARHQTLLTMHASERLALAAAQHAERQRPFTAAAMRVVSLIESTPGLRSILAPILKHPSLNPAVRHEQTRAALSARHEREKRVSLRRLEVLDKLEKRERAALRTAVTRKLRADERRHAGKSAARDDHLVAKQSEIAAPNVPADDAAKADAGANTGKEAWKQRHDKLAADRGVSQKRKGPGYRLKRDDP